MFQLVKLRSDVARVKRHMEERGQQTSRGAANSEGDGSDDGEMPPLHMDEPYYGIDEYSYEMEAMARGRFGRNMRHEASKQARHEKKRARKLEARAERLEERIGKRLQAMGEAAEGEQQQQGSGSSAAVKQLPRLERLSQAPPPTLNPARTRAPTRAPTPTPNLEPEARARSPTALAGAQPLAV